METLYMALLTVAMAAGTTIDASATPAKGARTVVRTHSMVLTPVTVPTGVIPGTLGGTLFGYPHQTTISGALERQIDNGQVDKLRLYQGRLFYGNSELNGSLPLLDQISWMRWQDMDYKPQVVGPMSVMSTRQGTKIRTLTRQTKFSGGVPVKVIGASVSEY